MTVYNRYIKLRKAIRYPDGSIEYIVPFEEKKGELISQENFESLEDCLYDYIFRWYQIPLDNDDPNTFICEKYSQYYKEVYQKSTDGIHWSDFEPRQERKGDLISEYSEACGYNPLIQWRLVEIDFNNPDTYLCEGFDLYRIEAEYISKDDGATFEPTGNIRKGSLYATNSEYCGYKGAIIAITPTDTPIYYAYYDKDGVPHKSAFRNRLELNQFTNGELGIKVQYEDYYKNGEVYLSFESIKTNMFLRFYKIDEFSNLTNIDTRYMTDMSYMFEDCGKVLDFDFSISHFITSGVTDMSHMFYNSVVPSYTVYEHWDTSKVNDMSYMFAYSQAGIEYSLEYLDTTNVSEMKGMFNGMDVQQLNIQNLKTSNVTDMSYMFASCTASNISASDNFDTSNVTNMSYMFYDTNISNRTGFTSIFDYLDTSKVTNMSYMFYRTTGYDTYKTITLNTSNVTDMSYMFAEGTNLFNVDVSKFNTSKVVNMSNMFNNNKSTSLNISRFNTTNVTDMSYMFDGCTELTSLDIGGWVTSNVTTMERIFNNCKKIQSLTLTNFNTEKVTNMSYMFGNCPLITSLDLNRFTTLNVTDMSGMFESCSGLESLDLSNFVITNVTKMDDMFYSCNALRKIKCHRQFYDWCIKNRDIIKLPLALVRGTVGGVGSGCNWELIDFEDFTITPNAYFSVTEDNEEIKIVSNINYFTSIKLEDSGKELIGYAVLQSIEYVFETQGDKGIMFMFDNSSESINGVFQGCAKLKSINTSSWDTSNVTDMSYAFSSCGLLTDVNIDNIITSNVTTMNSMFSFCRNIASLNLSSFNTSNVTDMSSMFNYCESLTSLDLSNFDITNVTSMNRMFYNCNSLTNIRCKQAFKDWCISKQDTIKLPEAMREGGSGTWEIV